MTTAAPALAFTPAAPSPIARPNRLRSSRPALLVIANPHASGIAERGYLPGAVARVLRDYGARVERRLTESPDELADVVLGEERRIVLVGGDGSVHAAANIGGPKPELALVPAGKANNLAHALGVPVDLHDAALLAVAGKPRSIDAIVANTPDRRYVAIEGVSIGFHAQARSLYHGENSADIAAGVSAAARALAAFEPISIGVESDGRQELLTVSQLFVSNFPRFAYGLQVAPEADPSDGRLDLVSVGPRSRVSLIATLKRMRDGTHVGRHGIEQWQASRIRINTRGRSPIIADTTNLESSTVELTVQRDALELVAP